MFLSALSLFSNDLAIDLGTANTCVFARGKGIVTSEPSIVAINTVTSKIEAVGNEAREMLAARPGTSPPSAPCGTASSPTSSRPRACSRTSSARRSRAAASCGRA